MGQVSPGWPGLVTTDHSWYLDDQNYQNVCRLLQSSCLRGQDVQLRHVGRCGVPEPCPLFCPHTGEQEFCGDNLRTYPRCRAWLSSIDCNTNERYSSMCHVQAEICRGGGPNYVTEGGCHQLKTLIQKALNTGSTLSPGESEVAWSCPGLYCPYAFYFLTDGQTAYIDSSCGAELSLDQSWDSLTSDQPAATY